MLHNIVRSIRRYWLVRHFQPTTSKRELNMISRVGPAAYTTSMKEWRPGLLAGSVHKVG